MPAECFRIHFLHNIIIYIISRLNATINTYLFKQTRRLLCGGGRILEVRGKRKVYIYNTQLFHHYMTVALGILLS